MNGRRASRGAGWRLGVGLLATGALLGVAAPAYATAVSPSSGFAPTAQASQSRQPGDAPMAGATHRAADATHRAAGRAGAPTDHPRAMTWTWSGPTTSPLGTADPTLQYVQVADGSALAQAFYAFRLPAGLTAAQLDQASLAIPVDTSQADGYAGSSSAEVPTLEVCPVSTAWTPTTVPPGSPQSSGPTYSCTAITASQGALGTTGSATVATFDVTALVGAWLAGTRNDGLAVTANAGSASLPLEGAGAVLDITTFPSTSLPTGAVAAPPPASSVPPAAGAPPTAYTPASPLTPLSLPSAPPVAAPAAASPVLAGSPATQRPPAARRGAQTVSAAPASDRAGSVPVILWLLLGLLAAALARAGRLLGNVRGAAAAGGHAAGAPLDMHPSLSPPSRGVGVRWTSG